MKRLHLAAQPTQALADDPSGAVKGIRYGDAWIGKAVVLRRCMADTDIDMAWHREVYPNLIVPAAVMVIRHLDDDLA